VSNIKSKVDCVSASKYENKEGAMCILKQSILQQIYVSNNFDLHVGLEVTKIESSKKICLK
jgi:hypothetical protein